jgi:alkylation response protein AidB-like acyl-CoA dehydrogenase
MRETPENRILRGRDELCAWERARPRNFFESDENLQRVLEHHLGERYPAFVPLLSRVGSLAATRMDELARLCNRDENLPVLRRWNGVGEAVEEVIFHAAHHELGGHFWGSGALTLLKEPGHETISGGLIYLMDHNGEAGHACPLACTAGLIKLIQRVGSEEQRSFLLPSLYEPDYAARLHASQFITEVQGGSDVGANDCLAVPDESIPGRYRVSGEKWFCSVADASLFVVTARLSGSPAGTPGLGLFLVPRLVDGRPNGFAIRRLKYKLGTRSMASGEIDFDRALAEPIGSLDQGFKNLIGIVLDTSRLHNAVAAAGVMRRALLEAHTFARHRRAFDRPILEYPAIQATLARMKASTHAAVANTFRILALGDRLARQPDVPGAAELRAARRTHVNINKYSTSVACTAAVRDGIEVLGGNGTIEEFSVLPRLYRDSIVLESWEGTHNTLCAQVLRDFRQRGLHRPWLAELRGALEGIANPSLRDHRARAASLLDEVGRRIERVAGSEPWFAERHIRFVVDRMCATASFVALLLELEWELAQGIDSDKAGVVETFRLLQIDPKDPMESDAPGELQRWVSSTL